MESGKKILSARFSAPSKIILTGEHSVVYGHPAIAFAVGCNADLEAEENKIYDDITKRTTCTVDVFEKSEEKRPFLVWKSELYETIYDTYENLCDFESRPELEKLGAQTFLKSVETALEGNKEKETQLAEKYCFDITFKFGIPIGAGLGSSASFNSVATGSVYSVYKHLSQETLPKEISISEEDLKAIKDLTHYGESLVHGNPSGIDSYIINEGGVVKFRKTEDDIKCDHSVKIPVELDFDILFTGVHRSTKTLLTNMINLKTNYSEVFHSLIGSIATVTNEFEKILQGDTLDTEKLIYLTNVNHKLLQSLQLSIPIIDKLTIIAEEHKIGLKITGAGAGGCLLLIYNENSDKEGFYQKFEPFKAEGAQLLKAIKSDEGFGSDSWTIF